MANTKSLGIAYTDQAISGGTVDNSPVGLTTRSTGAFTTLATNSTTTLGDGASDLISFHGATAVSQAAFVSTATRVAVTGGVGFSTTAEFSSFVVSMNSILTLLQNKGLMAAS